MLIDALVQLREKILSVPKKDRTTVAHKLLVELQSFPLPATRTTTSKPIGIELVTVESLRLGMVVDSASHGWNGVFQCTSRNCPYKEQ